jgi:hypothetical protein
LLEQVKRRNADVQRIIDALTEATPPKTGRMTEKTMVQKQSTRVRYNGKRDGSQFARFGMLPGASQDATPHRSKRSSTTNTRNRHSRSTSTASTKVRRRLSETRKRRHLGSGRRNPFDAVIFFGDLNYRVDLPRADIVRTHSRLVGFRSAQQITWGVSERESNREQRVDKCDVIDRFCYFPASGVLPTTLARRFERLLRHDQLNQQRKLGRAFVGFEEGAIRFPPTYKYDKRADCFDTSSKKRSPAWTDRILYWTRRHGNHTAGGADPVAVHTNTRRALRRASPRASGTCVAANSGTSTLSVGSLPQAPVLRLKDYYSVDARTSDHRPVCAEFLLDLSPLK